MSNNDPTHGSGLTRINLFLPPKAVCPQTLQGVNRDSGATPFPKISVKNYMSYLTDENRGSRQRGLKRII
jgi:hypothetical protein